MQKEREIRNVLKEYDYKEEEINSKLQKCFDEIFVNKETRIYFDMGKNADTGYMCDTGNNDARTEGMSYGMMMAVQCNRQDIFDKLWLWSKKYMWHESGEFAGYFAWSCRLDGTRNFQGPAPDGEEYYAMALLFASRVFGDREEPFDYSNQAKKILHEMLHKGADGGIGDPMFNRENKYILFVPGSPFSDPSYHLPHFYELFAQWGDPKDKELWLQIAEKSRKYLHIACHEKTGLAPDYAHFDGTPVKRDGRLSHTHYSDSYRVALNIGLDALWFGKDSEWQEKHAERLQQFYLEHPYAMNETVVTIDGEAYPEPILHPLAITATAAAISAARPKNKISEHFIHNFMNSPLRKDKRRYYDNCLYFFSLLALSGRFVMK